MQAFPLDVMYINLVPNLWRVYAPGRSRVEDLEGVKSPDPGSTCAGFSMVAL